MNDPAKSLKEDIASLISVLDQEVESKTESDAEAEAATTEDLSTH
ncbi:MAG: hypothetical protein P8Y12_03525 [Gammaproteobacteria bacterium]